jgi:hypothetical protein
VQDEIAEQLDVSTDIEYDDPGTDRVERLAQRTGAAVVEIDDVDDLAVRRQTALGRRAGQYRRGTESRPGAQKREEERYLEAAEHGHVHDPWWDSRLSRRSPLVAS